MWINPPNVYDVTIPSNHITIKTTAIICNIGSYLFLVAAPYYRCFALLRSRSASGLHSQPLMYCWQYGE